jgi:hypothetical protein
LLVLVDGRKESVGRNQLLPRNWQGSESSAAWGPFGWLPRSCDYGSLASGRHSSEMNIVRYW